MYYLRKTTVSRRVEASSEKAVSGPLPASQEIQANVWTILVADIQTF